MRHQRSGKKLGRDSAHRKALYANLTASLIEHGRIRTTETKAKALRPIAEKMITLGRDGSIHARRQALAYLRGQEIVHKLFSEVAPRFKDRPGGYTRVIKLGPRQGDAAPMAYIEFVDFVPGADEAEAEGSTSRGRLRRRRAEQPEQAEATA
jgi:large subunit ribosomal protein L17